MINETEARGLIDDLLEEQALVIGGLVAVHEVGDALAWKIIRAFDATRRKALRRLHERGAPEAPEPSPRPPRLRPHPAVEDFLRELRRA